MKVKIVKEYNKSVKIKCNNKNCGRVQTCKRNSRCHREGKCSRCLQKDFELGKIAYWG